MNPDQPSRAEIEVKLTALLLGELPEEEARLLRWTVAQDPELQQLHDQLQRTIGLVREVAAKPEAPGDAAPLKLSADRREKLLAHFRTPQRHPLFWLKPLPMPSLINVLVLVAIMAVLAAMLMPVLSGAKRKSQRVAQISYLSGKEVPASVSEDASIPQSAEIPAPDSSALAMPTEAKTEGDAVASMPTVLPPVAVGRANGAVEANRRGYYDDTGAGKSSQSETVAVVPAPVLAPPPPVITYGMEQNKNGPVAETMPPAAFGGGGGGGGGVYSQNPLSDVNGDKTHVWNFGSGTSSVTVDRPTGISAADSDSDGRATLKGEVNGVAKTELKPGTSAITPETVTAKQLAFFGDGDTRGRMADVEKRQIVTLGANATATPARPGESVGGAMSLRKPATQALADSAGAVISFGANVKTYDLTNSVTLDSGVAFSQPVEEKLAFPNQPAGVPMQGGAQGGAGGALSVKETTGTDFYRELAHGNSADFSSRLGEPAAAPSRDRQLQTRAAKTVTAVSGLDQRQSTASVASPVATDSLVVANQLAGDIPVSNSFQRQLAKVELPAGGRRLAKALTDRANSDEPVPTPHVNAPVPQPEVLTRENAFSTFSLNVSDVAFKLAAASLEKGQLPEVATLRSEEFINAFDYHDPEAPAGQPMAFAAERARYPFAVNRDLLRFSVKTAAAGRPANQPLNLVLLLDNSGSMERADRVTIIQAALKVLATQLHPQDTLSVVTFARTPHLWADGVRGDQAGETLDKAGRLTPQGGTNLEEAMRLAYETALRHYQSGGLNRVVLFTDGAANLGNVDAAALREKVEAARRQGVALDCFGIGWEGYNDDLLEQLSSHGDGRYAFLNAPEEVAKEFAAKLAGGLQVAASDVKVQVEFNPARVISWRQFGYAKHQLTKEQFRDNTVDAAEIGAREAGNALYTVETKPDGTGPIATVRVRYKVPGTADYQERSWEVPYTGNALSLEHSSAALRLAGTAGAFAEWLAQSPHALQVSPADLLKIIGGVPQIYPVDERPKQLEWMIREAQRLADK
jgi:Mg-chelatase subunit ChlD